MPGVALVRIDRARIPPVEEHSALRKALALLIIANVATARSIGACAIVVLGCILMIIKVKAQCKIDWRSGRIPNVSVWLELSMPAPQS